MKDKHLFPFSKNVPGLGCVRVQPSCLTSRGQSVVFLPFCLIRVNERRGHVRTCPEHPLLCTGVQKFPP